MRGGVKKIMANMGIGSSVAIMTIRTDIQLNKSKFYLKGRYLYNIHLLFRFEK